MPVRTERCVCSMLGFNQSILMTRDLIAVGRKCLSMYVVFASVNGLLTETPMEAMRARGVKGNEEVLTRRRYTSKSEARQIRRKAKCGGVTKCTGGNSCDEVWLHEPLFETNLTRTSSTPQRLLRKDMMVSMAWTYSAVASTTFRM
jgi:hypothetical protein